MPIEEPEPAIAIAVRVTGEDIDDYRNVFCGWESETIAVTNCRECDLCKGVGKNVNCGWCGYQT